MNFKTLFLIPLFITSLYASFEKLTIGTMDSYYKNKISKEQIYKILKEIENDFETQLGKDIFDYSSDGKQINFIYLPPTSMEKSIARKIKRIKDKRQKITQLETFFSGKKEQIEDLSNNLKKEHDIVNNEIKTYNKYIKEINSNKNLTMEEFKKAKDYSLKEKKRLDSNIKNVNLKRRTLSKTIRTFNSNVIKYNNLISSFNRLNIELESMNRHYTKVQGRTYGFETTEKKTTFKDGKKVEETSTSSTTMNKIEIYGFKDLKELKIILAHEIAHLVGIPHTDEKDALMNPIIQKRQLEEGLFLTPADIKLFKNYFNKKESL